MTIWFVSRHPGAMEWARRKGIPVDRLCRHLQVELLQPGDAVLGTLPIHLAAQVCRHGANFVHLRVDLPPHARGRELSADELDAFGARLEKFHVLAL